LTCLSAPRPMRSARARPSEPEIEGSEESGIALPAKPQGLDETDSLVTAPAATAPGRARKETAGY
jgi:hypothetical protein